MVRERIASWVLRCLPAETAHRLAFRAMRKRRFAPGPSPWLPPHDPCKGVSLLSTPVCNPLGLAAGFDKNGLLVDAACEYGFGFVEVGSVSWETHAGNPRPRMFRLDGWDVLNRMGLNSDGAAAVAENLARVRQGRYGINIAKSNKPTITGEEGITDVLRTFSLLRDRGFYHVLNLSCPNTHDGATFEDPAVLRELLPEVRNRARHPWGVKLSPHRDRAAMDETLAVCEMHGCRFYVMGNTFPAEHGKYGKGGRSGRYLLPFALPRVSWLAETTGKPVVACGGVFTGCEAYLYELAGACAVQVFNGFVRGPYSGPRFAQRVVGEWSALASATLEF